MQRTIILFSIIAVVFLFSGFQINNIQNPECECQFIGESFIEISKIRTGMTRKDLLEVFGEEGGISNRIHRRYVYKKCSLIKVDVEFKAVENEDDNLTEFSGDKIIKISKPFLESAIID